MLDMTLVLQFIPKASNTEALRRPGCGDGDFYLMSSLYCRVTFFSCPVTSHQIFLQDVLENRADRQVGQKQENITILT